VQPQRGDAGTCGAESDGTVTLPRLCTAPQLNAAYNLPGSALQPNHQPRSGRDPPVPYRLSH